MEKLNSALIAGEIPFLFTNDEMEGLLQSLQVPSHDLVRTCNAFIGSVYFPTLATDSNVHTF